jgi:hypothetical protein
MSISGNLKTMELADILQWLSNGEYTGTLKVSYGGIDKSLFFRDGQLISCTSTDPKEFLGHFLVSHGVITERALEAAVTEQERSGGLLGSILVSHGAVEQDKLEKMLKRKAEESLYELFRWRQGHFEFVDNELPAYEMVPISLDVNGLVLEGTRRVDEWDRILEYIPSPECVAVSVGDLLEGEEDEARRAVLELVNDDRTVEEICLQTHSGEFFVCEILFRKVHDGKLKMVRPRVLSVVNEESGTTTGALLEQARAHLDAKRFPEALRRLRAVESLEPDNPEAVKAVKAGENEIRAYLEIDGVDTAGVPVLSTPLAELSSMSFSPEEGFILSRINGANDLASILKISPLAELDALLVVWRLKSAGHIELKFE